MMRITPCSNAHLLIFCFSSLSVGAFFSIGRMLSISYPHWISVSLVSMAGSFYLTSFGADCIKEEHKISIIPNPGLKYALPLPDDETNVTSHWVTRRWRGQERVARVVTGDLRKRPGAKTAPASFLS